MLNMTTTICDQHDELLSLFRVLHMTAQATTSPLVPSVRNAIAILRHLGATGEPEGVNAIARALDLSPSSCFNLMKTLVHEGLLEFEAGSKKYVIGRGLAELARLVDGDDLAIRVARPLIDAIARKHRVSAGLWRAASGDRLTLIALSESPAGTRIQMSVGQRQPTYAGATGRALAAERNTERDILLKHFKSINWRTAPLFDDYAAQIETTKTTGWASDDNMLFPGVMTIASAISVRSEMPDFIISCTMFSGQFEPQQVEEIGRDIRHHALRFKEELSSL